jgi:hypothetical protein
MIPRARALGAPAREQDKTTKIHLNPTKPLQAHQSHRHSIWAIRSSIDASGMETSLPRSFLLACTDHACLSWDWTYVSCTSRKLMHFHEEYSVMTKTTLFNARNLHVLDSTQTNRDGSKRRKPSKAVKDNGKPKKLSARQVRCAASFLDHGKPSSCLLCIQFCHGYVLRHLLQPFVRSNTLPDANAFAYLISSGGG